MHIHGYPELISVIKIQRINASEPIGIWLKVLGEAGGMTYDKLIRAILGLISEGDYEGRYTDEFKAFFLERSIDMEEGWFIRREGVKRTRDSDILLLLQGMISRFSGS